MPTRTYSRKVDSIGYLADPTRGDPSFSAGILTALPGRAWRTVAGDDVVLNIDGGDLTQQEDDDLTAAHTAWVPTCQCRYTDTYEVEKIKGGRTQKIEWFETDDGDGDYSDLARDKVWSWTGSVLNSTTIRSYYKDGTVVPKSTVTSTYYTTGNGDKVKKVTQ